MDNPKNLRLWDCAVCNEEGEDRAIYPPDLQTARQPGGIPQFPPGVSKMGSARFDTSSFDNPVTPMRTPHASGAATPAINESSLHVSQYHYLSSTKDRGRYDRPVQLRPKKQSAYGEMQHMEPLSPGQLHTPAVSSPRQASVHYTAPASTQKPTSLYKDASVSGPQKLLDATQTMVQEAWETVVSPSGPLLKSQNKDSSSGGLWSFLPSYLSTVWSSGEVKPAENENRIEVTKSIVQQSAGKQRPPSYGGAYATSPYHIPRPSHVAINDFPSPSRTPYHPQATNNRFR